MNVSYCAEKFAAARSSMMLPEVELNAVRAVRHCLLLLDKAGAINEDGLSEDHRRMLEEARTICADYDDGIGLSAADRFTLSRGVDTLASHFVRENVSNQQ